MIQLHITLAPAIDGHSFPTYRLEPWKLRGLFFQVLDDYVNSVQNDKRRHQLCDEKDALHNGGNLKDPKSGLPAPMAYTLAPTVEAGLLTGLVITLFDRQYRNLVLGAWEAANDSQKPLKLGHFTFIITSLDYKVGHTYMRLAQLPPCEEVRVRFVAPTTFKLGKGRKTARYLPFPLIERLYSRLSGPLRVWDYFAPDELRTPDEWLCWAQSHLYIKEHRIQTKRLRVNAPTSRDRRSQELVTGFAGTVTIRAERASSAEWLCRWHTLLKIGEASGYGYKSTIGCGANKVESISIQDVRTVRPIAKLVER